MLYLAKRSSFSDLIRWRKCLTANCCDLVEKVRGAVVQLKLVAPVVAVLQVGHLQLMHKHKLKGYFDKDLIQQCRCSLQEIVLLKLTEQKVVFLSIQFHFWLIRAIV